jgi:hypothetical protein
MRGERGSAIVEVLLSVPFLFLFAIALVDFTRGYMVSARAHRAARHVAWCEGRRTIDPSHPGAPTNEDLNKLHFAGGAGGVGSSHGTEELESPFGSDAMDGVKEAFEAFGVDISEVGRGVVWFFLGRVDVNRGTVTKAIVDTRPMFSGGDLEANHRVSLDSRPESEPSDPRGWWDPFQDFWDEVEDLFDL